MNEYIASAVDQLYEVGIREAVISPGSRSTPVSMFFCEYGKYRVFLDIDERSAAFFALGIAKEHKRPVVLVCTSGSAAAHYLPALTEARYSRIPLIVLTADRSFALQNVGAPQTIDQNRIFGEYVNYYEELAIPDQENTYTYPRTVMQKAYMQSCKTPSGPVHINIPMREPLIPDLNKKYFVFGRSLNPFRFQKGRLHPQFDLSIIDQKRGLIICGSDADCSCQQDIIALGRRLKAAVLADPLSNIRNYDSAVIIDSYDAFLKEPETVEALAPEYLLLLGQPPVSKRLQQFIAKQKDVICIQVDPTGEYRNPALNTTYYVHADIDAFVRLPSIVNHNDCYLRQWQYYQKAMREKIETAVWEPDVFEGKIVQSIQSRMSDGQRLVVANSMAVRDVDYFWKAQQKQVPVLCNRGVNGIDGIISTALGISTGGCPTVLLTGDLAFIHDLNGLVLGKTHELNLVIVLLNNDGGGIFQYLPQKGTAHFDYLFDTPHGLDFQGVQTLYGVKYYKPAGYKQFQEHFQESLGKKGITVIEVSINKEQSKKLHDKYTTPQGS